MWQQLIFAFSDNGGWSNAVTRVEWVDEGKMEEYIEQEDVERVVREMTQDRFTLADSSPVCNGLLGKQLGYLADTDIAQSILNVTFAPPPETSDATVLVLAEIGRIAAVIRQGGVCLTLLPEEFTIYWRAIKESTSSSYSKVHFGHYKVAAMYLH